MVFSHIPNKRIRLKRLKYGLRTQRRFEKHPFFQALVCKILQIIEFILSSRPLYTTLEWGSQHRTNTEKPLFKITRHIS